MAEIAETKYGLDGKVTFEQSDGTIKVVDLANLGGAAGAGVTNLTVARNGTTVTIESDTGNDAVIPVATSTQAGIMSAAQAVKLAAQADTPVLSVAARGGNVVLTPTDVGLGSVNNTSDAAKPISTATQLALNQKQNNLVGVTDVPGLSTALAGKQATISTYTEVPGLTVALNAKQATLTSVADVPNLQAALDAKMGNTVAAVSSVLTATDAAGRATFRNAGYISTHLGAVGSEAAMLALANVRVGDTLRRTDLTPNVDFRCDGLPSSTLANWRNLGAATGPGGAVNVQTGALVASATDAPNASAVIDALAVKSDKISVSPVVADSVVTLTRAAGYWNRGLHITNDKIIETDGATLDGEQIFLFNASSTVRQITSSAGAALLSIQAGQWGELTRSNALWKDTSSAGGSGGGGCRAFNFLPAVNVAPSSTTNTLMSSVFVPSVASQARFVIDFTSDASAAAGARNYILRISDSADFSGAYADLAYVTVASTYGRADVQMRVWNTSATTQSGQSPNIAPGPYGAAPTGANRYTGTIDTTAGVYVGIYVQKTTAADVVGLQAAQLVVYQ